MHIFLHDYIEYYVYLKTFIKLVEERVALCQLDIVKQKYFGAKA